MKNIFLSVAIFLYFSLPAMAEQTYLKCEVNKVAGNGERNPKFFKVFIDNSKDQVIHIQSNGDNIKADAIFLPETIKYKTFQVLLGKNIYCSYVLNRTTLEIHEKIETPVGNYEFAGMCEKEDIKFSKERKI